MNQQIVSNKGLSKKNLTHLWLMGRVEQDHVLHVLVDVPWVRLDEVKGVVHDDPTDPVILCLGAVVLVSLPPILVQFPAPA